MLLGRILERTGLSEVLAPVERPPAQKPATGLEGGIQSPGHPVVAEPGNTIQAETEDRVPPSSAFPPPADQVASSISIDTVQCIHCKKFTPLAGAPPSSSPTTITTPTKTGTIVPSSSQGSHLVDVDMQVLSAARETSEYINSPPDVVGNAAKLFRFCGSSKPLNDCMKAKMKKLLKKNPNLLNARASGLGQLAPDSFTPLMAAAHANHIVAANVIFDFCSRVEIQGILSAVDYLGRTALHVASELGHLEMVELLKERTLPGSPVPVDLSGRTPLGLAVTSPIPGAKKNQKALVGMLYKPGDISICGKLRPGGERTGISEDLQLAYGTADMPGFRVRMEDALCTQMWKKDRQSYCILGVLDGHGDRGMVSQFSADHFVPILQSNILQTNGEISESEWKEIFKRSFLALDDKIKEKSLIGGSTAVLALITIDSIIVANVGDSRCILVQSGGNNSNGDIDNLAESLGAMSVASPAVADEGYPPAIDQDQLLQATPTVDGPIVLALSEDQKPNLDIERARIENAGMNVISVKFEENGEEITIYKVERSKEEQLAVSRALGDFEYKGNMELGPEEQAVVAVPEIRFHNRNHGIDSYLVLACDGVWDVMSNEDVAKFVQREVELKANVTESVLTEVADALLNACLDLGSKDNMTVTIVALSQCMEKLSVSSTAMEGKTLDFLSPRKK